MNDISDSSLAAPPESRFWPHLAIIIWCLAFLGLCGRTLLLKVDAHSVYPVFTTAAQHWRTGSELYVRGGTEEFRYSPLVAAFFVPFQMLPPRVGQFVWRSLNFAVFLCGLWCCCKAGLPRKMTANQVAAVFLLVLPLAVGSLNNAQSNPLVIGLLMLAVAGVMREKWTLTAVTVTIATLFKVYPISIGLLLVLVYPLRFGWRLLVCLAAGLLLPFVLQHAAYVISEYQTWVHYMATEDRQHGPISDWYKDFRAAWRIYIAPMPAKSYLVIELATALLIAALCLFARLTAWPTHLLLVFLLALGCCWMTALGPATESSTYILLAPPLAWMILESAAEPRHRWRRIGYGVAFGLLLASQGALWFGAHGKWFRNHLQPLPVAGTILFVILIADALDRFRKTPFPPSIAIS